MIRKILNFALFQAGWFACVLGGAHDMAMAAVAAAVAVIVINLWWQRETLVCELRLIIVATVIGFSFDTVNLSLDVFSLNGTARFPHLCPVWLAALWAMFGTTLHGSLGWLAGRYWLAAILGAVAGTISYLGGARLGAVTMNPDLAFSVTVLACGWAAAMPLLVWLAHGKRTPGVTPNGAL